jgi:subtilisin family serine protease
MRVGEEIEPLMSTSRFVGSDASTRRRGVRRAFRLLIALTALVALSVTAAGAASGDTNDPVGESVSAGTSFEGSKSPTSRLAQTDPSLLGRTDSTPVNVMVKLDYDSTATYEGGVAGLEATSPGKTGRKLKNNRGAVEAYERHVATVERSVVSAIESAVSGESLGEAYRTVYGGVAMRLPADQIDELLSVDGVVAVQADTAEQPLTTVSPAWIGATSVWPSLGGSSRAGEGVIVGVLDTGVWPEHPSFRDPGISHPGGTFGCQFGDGSDPALGPAFACNDKLIGAYAFMATNMSVSPALPGEFCNNTTKVCSPRDADGHGTHTSSTAAGAPVAAAEWLGVDRGPMSGVAPGAHLIMFRVCDTTGCFQSDSVAAVQRAILDGVDVLNFSIAGGRNPYADAVELAFLDAYAAGILVNASAGNSGPGAGTVDHGGPWTNTVAASTSNRHFFGDLVVTASNGDRFTVTGATITDGVAAGTPVVLASEVPGQPNDLCAKPGEAGLPAPGVLFAPGSLAGKIVVCRREVGARVLKSHNASLGGATGMILYNGLPNLGLNTDNHWVPSMHIEHDGPAGTHPLVAFLASHTGETATFTAGTATAVRGDVMTSFSSRGPGVDFLKPDITAPGIQIVAGHTPDPHDANFVVGPPGQLFQAIAGTSMSSPHSAGASALVKDAHPDWTPGQIKSALMTSSLQSVLKQDGTTASDPFDRGAGALHVDRAVSPTLTFDETAARYFASAGDPLNRVHLNLPSINSTRMSGVLRTTRTFKNVSGQPQSIHVRTQAPAGSTISVSPSVIPIAPDESKTVEITIDGTNLTTGQQYFGQITFDPSRGGANDVVMPIAFVKAQGSVTMAHTCAPTTLTRDGSPADCTVTAANFASVPANVNIQVSSSFPQKLAIRNVAAPGVASGDGLSFTGTLSPALPPQIQPLVNGGAPFGFFPMASLGVAPQPGFGDDSLVNFNVNPFTFGTEPYSRVAVASNGYVVLGGGDGNDAVTRPQTFPNPNRPNNVLAAYWTDLNPAAGGAIFVAQVSAGLNRWLVVEWSNVALFSNPTQRRSAQIWIQQNTEKVTYAYSPVAAQMGPGDAAVGLNIGAENRTGQSGQNLGAIPAPGSSLTVNATPPAAGGTVTLAYQAFGLNHGVFDLLATMTSNVTNDTTTGNVAITVDK